MTRIDFYVLPNEATKGRQMLACRLADKAYQLGHTVYIHTDSAEQTEMLDTLLWTFRQNSFVPHAKTDHPGTRPAPVLFGNTSPPDQSRDVLINLSSQIPEFFSQYHRVAELVDQSARQLQSSRERYKFYQERGYKLETHKLESR